MNRWFTVTATVALGYACPRCGAPAEEACRSRTFKISRAGSRIKRPHGERFEVARTALRSTDGASP